MSDHGDAGADGVSVGQAYGLTLAEVCDVSYLLQAGAREREALALQAQAPFIDGDVPSVAQVLAEFDAWLVSSPEDVEPETPQDRAQRDLDEAMGVRRRI